MFTARYGSTLYKYAIHLHLSAVCQQSVCNPEGPATSHLITDFRGFPESSSKRSDRFQEPKLLLYPSVTPLSIESYQN